MNQTVTTTTTTTMLYDDAGRLVQETSVVVERTEEDAGDRTAAQLRRDYLNSWSTETSSTT